MKMATRCQIEWREIRKDESGKTRIYKVRIYRHWDGYPSAVLEDLRDFMKWNERYNDDMPYSVANFIYYMKKQRYNNYREINPEVERNGYGVEDPSKPLYGDEEYLYRITIEYKEYGNCEIYIEYTDLYDYTFKEREKLTFDKVEWKHRIPIDKLLAEAITQ